MLEIASFRQDDPAILVAASLACPFCLSGDVAWSLDADEPQDASVACRCRACGHERRVFLAPEQALRLAVAGP